MLVSQGTQVMDALNRAMIIEAPEDACGIPCKDTVQQKCYQSLLEAYDTKMAGFGTSPKFPQPGALKRICLTVLTDVIIQCFMHMTGK